MPVVRTHTRGKEKWRQTINLLQRAADLREHVVRVRSDQADGSDYDHQDDRQHHGVLGNVLALLVAPQLFYPCKRLVRFFGHILPFLGDAHHPRNIR